MVIVYRIDKILFLSEKREFGAKKKIRDAIAYRILIFIVFF